VLEVEREPTASGERVCVIALEGESLTHLMVYTTKHPHPNPIMRWVLRMIVKPKVVGPDPYPRNTPTAPAFRIKDIRDFDTERERLLAFLQQFGV
jgi:hypothetical protein